MKKILFLIHDLGPGGAEKVLVNLVNNMDHTQFDITVMSLFDEGVNRQFLSPKVTYKYCFKKMIRGNSHLMKLLSPRTLHRWLIKDHYDVEVAYLEGPCARIISGCENADTKKVCWIHCTMKSEQVFSVGFRNPEEAADCYSRFDCGAFVSEGVLEAFHAYCAMPQMCVLYNTNESRQIRQKALEKQTIPGVGLRWCGMGKLVENKGFDRMLRIQKRLAEEGYSAHCLILGEGPMRPQLEQYVQNNCLENSVTFLGYQTNPYKYLAQCDLFVCASFAEGFSTAATEALIVGTPVCTVEVSGMKEMLGQNDEWGIVTENDDEALYEGIKKMLEDPDLLAGYRAKAALRGETFSTENTVKAVEEMLLSL